MRDRKIQHRKLHLRDQVLRKEKEQNLPAINSYA